jgi:hypothetical protein
VKRLFSLTALVFLVVSLFLSSSGSAEEDSRLAYRPNSGGQRITCESERGRHSYCRTNTRGRVRLERRLSDAPCRQYDTWGADGDGSGIWVSNGCRAVFSVESYGPAYPGGGGGGRTVTCKSEGFGYKHCSIGRGGRRVRIGRQLSDTRCNQGDNWGVDRGGIWVDRGCGAEFVVE